MGYESGIEFNKIPAVFVFHPESDNTQLFATARFAGTPPLTRDNSVDAPPNVDRRKGSYVYARAVAGRIDLRRGVVKTVQVDIRLTLG